MAGRYAQDGSLRVSVVDGSTRTGLYAPDGSIYVVESSGLSFVGHSHPCGALNVTVVTPGTFVGVYAPDGSLNVIETSGTTTPEGAYAVTVVSGSFGTVTPPTEIEIFWFLKTWSHA